MDQILHRKLIIEKNNLQLEVAKANKEVAKLMETVQQYEAILASLNETFKSEKTPSLSGKNPASDAGGIVPRLPRTPSRFEKTEDKPNTRIPTNPVLRGNNQGRQLDEVTSQLTGALFRRAKRRYQVAHDEHDLRGRRAEGQGMVPRGSPHYWTANNPLGSALQPNERQRRAEGLVTNPADQLTIERQWHNMIPRGFEGTPIDVIAHQTPVKMDQASALHQIARGRESGNKDEVEAGKTKLSTLRFELARVRGLRRARRDALSSNVGTPEHEDAMRRLGDRR
jgi:hypothetical protein